MVAQPGHTPPQPQDLAPFGTPPVDLAARGFLRGLQPPDQQRPPEFVELCSAGKTPGLLPASGRTCNRVLPCKVWLNLKVSHRNGACNHSNVPSAAKARLDLLCLAARLEAVPFQIRLATF